MPVHRHFQQQRKAPKYAALRSNDANAPPKQPSSAKIGPRRPSRLHTVAAAAHAIVFAFEADYDILTARPELYAGFGSDPPVITIDES